MWGESSRQLAPKLPVYWRQTGLLRDLPQNDDVWSRPDHIQEACRGQDWLKRSIGSVLEQDYPNLELIVVNDEATEDIDELIRSFGIRKYVKNDRNRKLPYSLNRGFEVADGEYHSWTSADNYMLPGMITRLVTELERQNVSIMCGRSIVTDENDVLHDLSSSDMRTANLASCDLNAPRIEPRFTYYSSLGACFLYRKEVWEELRGYDEARHGSEDFDFWLRASHKFDNRPHPMD